MIIFNEILYNGITLSCKVIPCPAEGPQQKRNCGVFKIGRAFNTTCKNGFSRNAVVAFLRCIDKQERIPINMGIITAYLCLRNEVLHTTHSTYTISIAYQVFFQIILKILLLKVATNLSIYLLDKYYYIINFYLVIFIFKMIIYLYLEKNKI